jgi:hypothetical protein
MLPAAAILLRALFRKSQNRVMGQFAPGETLSFRNRPGTQPGGHSGLGITQQPEAYCHRPTDQLQASA